mgnify:FL=1
MKTSFKTALRTVLLLFLIGAVLAGCAQTGEERARDLNGATGDLNAQYQRFKNNVDGARYGNNLVGTKGNGMYGTDMTGTNRPNTTGNGMTNNMTGNNTGLNNMTGNNAGLNNTTGNGTANRLAGNDSRRAALIERQLENRNGIGDCEVLVNGDTALIGVKNITGNTANMSALRSSIERKVKQIDSSIRKVMVTDSDDILTRMGRLGTAGNNNGMATNFADEFNDLIERVRRTMM